MYKSNRARLEREIIDALATAIAKSFTKTSLDQFLSSIRTLSYKEFDITDEERDLLKRSGKRVLGL